MNKNRLRQWFGWLPATKGDLAQTEARILAAINGEILSDLEKPVQQLSTETASLEAAVKANQPAPQNKEQNK